MTYSVRFDREPTVTDLQHFMQEIRIHERLGIPCPLRHNLYRRYREAILDRTDLAREQQARRTLIERSL